jgi:hypothetical protein
MAELLALVKPTVKNSFVMKRFYFQKVGFPPLIATRAVAHDALRTDLEFQVQVYKRWTDGDLSHTLAIVLHGLSTEVSKIVCMSFRLPSSQV